MRQYLMGARKLLARLIRLKYSQASVKEVREEDGGMGEVVRRRVRWQGEGAKLDGPRAIAQKASDDLAHVMSSERGSNRSHELHSSSGASWPPWWCRILPRQ